ncbi:hypothetical protein MTO96_035242 [Rhipicephalus appendiculatus]
MDVTRHFFAFVIFSAGGLCQVQAFLLSPLNCHRIVPPATNTIVSPCTFPCLLPLGEGDSRVVFKLERDGTPCKGGFCKSGICKDAPSFPVQNHLKQKFISELKVRPPGIRLQQP